MPIKNATAFNYDETLTFVFFGFISSLAFVRLCRHDAASFIGRESQVIFFLHFPLKVVSDVLYVSSISQQDYGGLRGHPSRPFPGWLWCGELKAKDQSCAL